MTFAFNTLNELLTYLQAEIAPNGNQEITGQRHQDVVVTIAQSLVNIVASIPPTTVNQFPPYDADHVYVGGVEVIVRSANKLWLFVHADNQVGVTPGTNGLVWQEISAAQLAHFRNQDTHLALGTPAQVSAAELRALLDSGGDSGTSSWIEPVGDEVAEPVGDEVAGHRYVVTIGATGAFEGEDGKVAALGSDGWEFSEPPAGAMAHILGSTDVMVRLEDSWVRLNLNKPTPMLWQVLAAETYAMTLTVPGAFRRNQYEWEHAFGGVYVMPSIFSRVRLLLLSNVLIQRPLYMQQGWEVDLILVASSSSRTVAWMGGEFSVLPGLVLPTSISAGESVFIRFVEASGKLCAIACGAIS